MGTMFFLLYVIAYITHIQCDKGMNNLAKRLELRMRRLNGKAYDDICKNFCATNQRLGKYIECLDKCQDKMKECKISCRMDKDRDTKRFGTCVNTCVKKTNAPTTNPNKPKKTNDPKKKKKPKRPKKIKNNRLTKRLGLRRSNGRAYHDICKISCKDERPVKGAQMRLAVKYIKCLNNCEVRKKECKINCRMDKDRVPKKLRTCVNSCVKRVYLPLESKPETKKPEMKKPKTKKPKKKKPKKKKP